MSLPHAFCLTTPQSGLASQSFGYEEATLNQGHPGRPTAQNVAMMPYFHHPYQQPNSFSQPPAGFSLHGSQPSQQQQPPAYLPRLPGLPGLPTGGPSSAAPPTPTEQSRLSGCFASPSFQLQVADGRGLSPGVGGYEQIDESYDLSGRKRRSREDLAVPSASCPPSPVKGVNYSCMADMEAMGLLKDVPRKPPNSFGPGDWNAIRTCSKEWAGICHELLLAGYDIRLGEAGRSSLKKEISKKLKEKSHLREVCVAQVCRLKNANVMQLMQMAEIVGCLHTALRISSSYWREYNRKQSAGYALVGGHRRTSRVSVPGGAKSTQPRSRKNSNSEPAGMRGPNGGADDVNGSSNAYSMDNEDDDSYSGIGSNDCRRFTDAYGMPVRFVDDPAGVDTDDHMMTRIGGPAMKRTKLDGAEMAKFNFFDEGAASFDPGGGATDGPNEEHLMAFPPRYGDDGTQQFFHFSDPGHDVQSPIVLQQQQLHHQPHRDGYPMKRQIDHHQQQQQTQQHQAVELSSERDHGDGVGFAYGANSGDAYYKQEEGAVGISVDGLASDWIFSVLCSSAPVAAESPTDPTTSNSPEGSVSRNYYE